MRRVSVSFALAVALAALTASGCAPAGPHEIQIKVTENGFEPDHVTVPHGVPAVLVITREAEATCATEVVFAESGEKHELPLHRPVRVELPASAAGTLHYACGMDMFRGEITVQ